MSWKCQDCGRTEPKPPRQCPGCGAILVPPRVILTSEATGKEIHCGGYTLIGRVLLQRRLEDADAVYASERQFELLKDEARGVWVLRHIPAARNATSYNGVPVPETGVDLTEGGVIA